MNEKPAQNAQQQEEVPQQEMEHEEIQQQEVMPQRDEVVEEMPQELIKKCVTKTTPPPRPLMGEWVTPKWIKYVAVAIGVLVLLFVLTIIFREQLRPLLENILYTKEELEIIQKWAAQ